MNEYDLYAGREQTLVRTMARLTPRRRAAAVRYRSP